MKKTFTSALITGTLASSLLLGGIDATKYEGATIEQKQFTVESEQISVKQEGSVVEANLPWKGEQGLTIKYDLNPSALEKITDTMSREVIVEKTSFGNKEALKIDILLKAKPDTNRFCYTIDGYENYEFLYQDPAKITDVELVAPELLGSYAVYHKTLRHHKEGGVNYETGKVAHIPYPYIWEIGKEDQKVRAENFTYSEGQLCVTAPQDFLDKADYTNGVRIDPTLGVTTIGALSLAQPGQDFYAQKATATEDGTVTAINTWAQDGAPDSVKGVLVTFSDLTIVANGVGPGAAVSTTAPPPSPTASTYSSSPTITNGVTYLIGEVNSSALGALYYDVDIAETGFIDGSNNYTTPTSPTDGAGSLNRFSIYMDYTVSGGGVAPAQDDEVIIFE